MLEHSKGNSQEFFEIPHPNVHISYISPLLTSKAPLRTRLRPPPPHTATFHSIHIPPHSRVSWNATPFHFSPRKIIHFQLFPVSLLTNHLPVYIIYEHTFYFFLGQLPGTRPEKRRLPFQNRSAPGKNSKGVVKRDSLCHKEGFPIAGNSGNEG